MGTCLAISRMADSVKLPATPLVPMRIVGRTYRITVSKSYRSASGKPNCAMSSRVRAKGCLSLSIRALPSNNRPAESSMTVAPPTVAFEAPSRFMASCTRRAMPIPAAPAPRNTSLCAGRGGPRNLALRPPRATLAVPWMSSLKLVMR